MALIILPIETRARELDYKIQLALLLTSRSNLTVSITPTTYAKKLAFALGKGALLIGKHLFRTRSNKALSKSALQRVFESNCLIIHLDEEGGLHLSGDHSAKDLAAFTNRQPDLTGRKELTSRVQFAHWGHYQKILADAINPDFEHQITGVPAFDACKVFGKSITPLNSSNEQKNLFIGITANACGASLEGKDSDSLLEMMFRQYKIAGESFIGSVRSEIGMLAIAESLAKIYPHHNIIYRPHPGSGRAELYGLLQKLSTRYSNFQISLPSRESSIDYLMRIDLNIHSYCTTSLQSFFLGKQTLHVKGFDCGFKQPLLHEPSCQPDEVAQFICDWVKRPSSLGRQHLSSLGEQLIKNNDLDVLSSYDSIIAMVNALLSTYTHDEIQRNSNNGKRILCNHTLTHQLKFFGKIFVASTRLNLPGINSQKSQTDTLYCSRLIRKQVLKNQIALSSLCPDVLNCSIDFLANGLIIKSGSLGSSKKKLSH